MKQKVFIGALIPIFLAAVVFVSNKFFAMPWENTNLPKLEDPRLIVKKNDRLLQVLDGENLVKTYNISMGSTPAGDKETEGDGKTPEGEFYIFTKNPNSKFYLSLGVSYPNIDAAKRGLREHLISQEDHDAIVKAIRQKQMPPQNTALGGEIYIHGGGTLSDWTRGCIALGNEEIKELFDAVPVGTIVKIEP